MTHLLPADASPLNTTFGGVLRHMAKKNASESGHHVHSLQPQDLSTQSGPLGVRGAPGQ